MKGRYLAKQNKSHEYAECFNYVTQKETIPWRLGLNPRNTYLLKKQPH